MLLVIQSALSVLEIVGAFLWIALWGRKKENKNWKKWIYVLLIGITCALTVFQRSGSMYSRWYLLICIVLCSLSCFWFYEINIRYFFAVALYFETVYCGDIILGIFVGQILGNMDFLREQQFMLTVWRVLILGPIRCIMAFILIFLYSMISAY